MSRAVPEGRCRGRRLVCTAVERPRRQAGRAEAHRAALDRLLWLIADAPWSDALVLRGSATLPAWLGEAAREPADLDWVVLEDQGQVDRLDPFPYVDELAVVQQWPEAADGAARYEMWRDEEFGTFGQRPLVAPEGLRWVAEWDPGPVDPEVPPYHDLLDRIRQEPSAGGGVVLDADEARQDRSWAYAYVGRPGIRLLVPWHADGLPSGTVQLDFSRDEVMPESPVWTPVPRGGGRSPVPVRTASPGLSLAWKLKWMRLDHAERGFVRGKDVYDSMLLAERGAVDDVLIRKVVPKPLTAEAVAAWPVEPGTPPGWMPRLAAALFP